MLYRGECYENNESPCLVADIQTNNMSDNKIYSNVEWSNAVNNNIVLRNVGFTGIDNGLITYRKDKISNKELLDIFVNSEYDLGNDKRFFMYPVSGNGGQYKYFYDLEDGYIALKGGFLQGFFKIHGEEYQTLPSQIEDEWNFEIVMRRRDYPIHFKTLNHTHSDNNGIFFYIGTRSENKFSLLYENMETVPNYADGYAEEGYFNFDEDGGCSIGENKNVHADCWEDDYFLSLDGEYHDKDILLDDITIVDKKGRDVSKKGFYEIETDNKFLTFDHTKYGFTTKTFDSENPNVIFEGRKDWVDTNYFVLLNQTSSGHTTKTIGEYHEANLKKYNIYKDIINNSFAVKVNKDGSLEYRYAVKDCDGENGFKIEKEISKPNLIPMDEWVTVNIRIFLLTPPASPCENRKQDGKIKIYFYVNGSLVMVSKELPEFNLKELNEMKDKQETVPYNISLGGGTQGLADAILFDDRKNVNHSFPLESNFCGTFIGDIKSFKFYNCFLDYQTINNNVFKY
jgi:hypothetical protein